MYAAQDSPLVKRYLVSQTLINARRYDSVWSLLLSIVIIVLFKTLILLGDVCETQLIIIGKVHGWQGGKV